jgi:hypothetical protein
MGKRLKASLFLTLILTLGLTFAWSPALAQDDEQQKRAAEVKPELTALFDELKSMRDTRQFLELGFSGKNPPAVAWKQKVEECRARLEKDVSVPGELRVVPAYLLNLGLHWIQSKGKTNSDVEWDIEMINAGLNWKPDE